jgi:hypothetical protein
MSTSDILIAATNAQTTPSRGLARHSQLPRIAALAGFAGAVIMLGALLSLFAQLGLGADATALPSLSTSAGGLVLGAALRLVCRPIAEHPVPSTET